MLHLKMAQIKVFFQTWWQYYVYFNSSGKSGVICFKYWIIDCFQLIDKVHTEVYFEKVAILYEIVIMRLTKSCSILGHLNTESKMFHPIFLKNATQWYKRDNHTCHLQWLKTGQVKCNISYFLTSKDIIFRFNWQYLLRLEPK